MIYSIGIIAHKTVSQASGTSYKPRGRAVGASTMHCSKPMGQQKETGPAALSDLRFAPAASQPPLWSLYRLSKYRDCRAWKLREKGVSHRNMTVN
jgi:hypothetical protein